MKGRKQPTLRNKGAYPRTDRTASEGYGGEQTFIGITENNLSANDPNAYGIREYILSPANLNTAYKQVKRNKGAGGIDKMEVPSLQAYLISHKTELIESIQRGNHRPNPVRRVSISKDNGKNRQLGIPTVVDRVIQQAITQVLSPIYERQFSPHSYGFRPRRNAHQALRKSQQYITECYDYAVDMDLEKFFDTVSHSKLIEVLSRTIDQWYRRRLRMVIWKQWKRIRTKLVNLKRLGVENSKAWQWANTRKSYWHTANSYILSTTLTIERLRKAGYVFFSDYYRKIKLVN